ncbi:MAG: DHH family phosphoesterase, partial [Synergistaceae bacterium]|nr:DHH family phosphoesterase [Synergistaceae bacterium]
MELINEHIAIQCHNIPDADALASGFGLFRFFESRGNQKPKFFYGGPPITKPNLTGMIEDLQIPVEHAPDLTEWDGLLVTTDSQHGAGNVMRVSAPRVAVIDHHIQEADLPPLCDLRPWLGSCSTLVWNLLREAAFSIDIRLGTALYYGLFTDTNGFSEVRHPLDRDMWDTLVVNQAILKKLKRSNLALSDLTLASTALKDLYFDAERRFVIISTPPCDPNLLGFVSDLAMQVDSVDLAVAYSEGIDGYKFSVRTAAREAKSSELAAWLSKDVGSGGGHREKAGGYISKTKYKGCFGDWPPQAYFDANLKKYLEAFRIVDCENPTALADAGVDVTAMKVYRKLPVRLGFVSCRKLFEGNADLQIRMLEGDVDIIANEKTVLMIGVKGEVYPMELAQ